MTNIQIKTSSKQASFKETDTQKGCVLWVDDINPASRKRIQALFERKAFQAIEYLSGEPNQIHLLQKALDKKVTIKPIFVYKRNVAIYEDIQVLKKQEGRALPLSRYTVIRDQLLRLIKEEANVEKVALHLEQQLGEDLWVPYKMIANLFIHFERNGLPNEGRHTILLKETVWMKSIKNWFEKQYITMESYSNPKEQWMLAYNLGKIISEIMANFVLILCGKTVPTYPRNEHSKIAVMHSHGTNLEGRCDYFWYPESGIASTDLIVYFLHEAHPCTKDVEYSLKKAGIPWYDLTPRKMYLGKKALNFTAINVLPSMDYIKRLWKLSFMAFKLIFKAVVAHDRVAFWVAQKTIYLLNDVYFFETFFEHCNVKINYALNESGRHMSAMNIAIDQLEGVDASNHWSHLDQTNLRLAKPFDVYFSWGSYYYKHFFHQPFYHVGNIVMTGFPYDYSFSKNISQANALREQLQQKEAKFIMSYFDTGVYEPDTYCLDAQREMFIFLLNKVIEDKSIGLIIKSKKLSSREELEEVMPDLGDLFTRAVETGRCLILKGMYFPNVCAQASDLVVNVSTTGSPALEAALVKTRAIFYDIEHYRDNPMLKNLLGKSIFRDMDDFKNVIESFIEGVVAPDVGNFSVLLKEVDPFQDGKARNRIGQYLFSLQQSFNKGHRKNEAITQANAMYRDLYGPGMVIQPS